MASPNPNPPESRARERSARKKRLEQARQIGRRRARAVVFDGDFDERARARRRRARARGVFERVVPHIVERARQRAAVGAREKRLRIEAQIEAGALGLRAARARLFAPFRHIERRGVDAGMFRSRFGVLQNAVGERFQFAQIVGDAGAGFAVFDELGREFEARDRRSQLVRSVDQKPLARGDDFSQPRLHSIKAASERADFVFALAFEFAPFAGADGFHPRAQIRERREQAADAKIRRPPNRRQRQPQRGDKPRPAIPNIAVRHADNRGAPAATIQKIKVFVAVALRGADIRAPKPLPPLAMLAAFVVVVIVIVVVVIIVAVVVVAPKAAEALVARLVAAQIGESRHLRIGGKLAAFVAVANLDIQFVGEARELGGRRIDEHRFDRQAPDRAQSRRVMLARLLENLEHKSRNRQHACRRRRHRRQRQFGENRRARTHAAAGGFSRPTNA